MTTSAPRHLFTVHDYYLMAKAGILGEDDRVELIEGEIVEMPPIGSHHSSVVERLNWLFSRRLNLDEVLVRVQDALRLSIQDEPQPDIAIVRFREDFYRIRHPGPEEVLLVIEVADLSLAFDLGEKAALYARAGVPELWVVDINAATVNVLRESGPGGYARRAELSGTDLLVVESLRLLLQVDELLGPTSERS